MRFDVTPSLFYGSAVAAALGLSLGLVLHGPWESHAGGPQLRLASAAADELARPRTAEDEAAAAEPDVQIAQNDQAAPEGLFDTAYLPPTPLPVTRLKPEMFDPPPVVVAATAEEPERQTADALDQDAGVKQVASADN